MEYPDHSPLVSIITATYNRSNVLRYAILSVLNSTYENWEMIIVNDASTDDTSEVVKSFNDPRIKLVELKENYGVQSGPNNEGLKYARGDYVAYLSHDDLWFPDHLEKLMKDILETKADWVFSWAINIISESIVSISGIFPTDYYNPMYGYAVASLWLVKKNVIKELGGWRHSNEIRQVPSQDLLIRAFKANKVIRMVPAISVIIFPSGSRKNCYIDKPCSEQEYYYSEILNNPNLKEQMISKAYFVKNKNNVLNSFRIKYTFLRFLLAILKRLARLLNIDIATLSALIKHGKKGSFINKIMISRGLEPVRPSKQ